jgi:hypothetical protein
LEVNLFILYLFYIFDSTFLYVVYFLTKTALQS